MTGLRNVGITGLGHYLPKRRLTNFDLEKMVDTSDEWITARTGIKERRVADIKQNTSDLATPAAREALKNANLDAHDVELIIVATISPDSNFPSVACLVQKAIHAKKATAFDVSAACSGFLYAITTAKQFIQTGLYNNALVIAAEKFTSLIDWTDRNTCVLFGDGAGACVLAPVHGNGIMSDFMHSQGQYAELMEVVMETRRHPDVNSTTMKIPHVIMRGQEIFKIAVNSMAEAVTVAAQRAKVDVSEIDCVVPHQANDRIISAVAKKIGVPKEKFFINIQKYGNTSAAACAIALYEAVHEGKIKKGDTVALVTFGAGLVSAANIVRW